MSSKSLTPVPWATGRWTNQPVAAYNDGDDLVVTAEEGSDAWLKTSYGFVHDTEHALVARYSAGTALEVTFTPRFTNQFDQAGLFIRGDDEHWIKAGMEFADGVPQLGAVVTDGYSDWSAAPVPDWNERLVTIRASWADDAITIRARVDDEPFRFVRLAPWPIPTPVEAGPFVCAPTRAGLSVRFHSWRTGDADDSLH
jgi:regulation of enolase protein 1 (concanavalin A-like superfamily)